MHNISLNMGENDNIVNMEPTAVVCRCATTRPFSNHDDNIIIHVARLQSNKHC